MSIFLPPFFGLTKKIAAILNGTLFSTSLSSDGNGWNGITGVERIPASLMTLPSGAITKVRLRLKASSVEGFTVGNMYIGHRAGSGNPYDFSTTPVQVLFGGSAGVTIGAGATQWSDWMTFAYNKSDDFLASFYANGGAGSDALTYNPSLTGASDYEKSGSDAATVDKTGYSATDGILALIDTIESDGF